MFDLLVDLGARLHITNKQGLTPLTLAAKLARKEVCPKKWSREKKWSRDFLRMYCIDRPGVPESRDACTFHGSYESYMLVKVP